MFVLQVMVVREDNLSSVQSKMKEVISVHIYSVQCTKLKDLSVLYSADYNKVTENIMSSTK